MATLKPFKGLRPPKEFAKEVAARPYDVLSSEEAREEATEYSLLHITKPEIDFKPGIDVHSQQVYDKAKENFEKFINEGTLLQDKENHLYIYAQTMEGRTQYGLVGCASVEDYMSGKVKKHELTRPDKEEDRMKHVRITNANMEPVFYAYRAVPEIDEIIETIVQTQDPEYDFTSEDDIGHHFWVIKDSGTINKLVQLFNELPATYIADGHHRTAAAALVGSEKKNANPNHTGAEEYNYFMAVHFPDNQLRIMDYNRVVKDLHGLTAEEFLEYLRKSFIVNERGTEEFKPERLHTFGMYLEGQWYELIAHEDTYDDLDPIGRLDVTILTRSILHPILDIKDLRTSKRIDFVGGTRGLGELKRRVDSGEMKVAFALFPVSMDQLMDIADTGNIMPPKSTWFAPKLRSGLIVHSLE
ncbi:MAG: hypothetical protein AMJ88_06110 [Anaerolineae bacterium SM23_ 63]|nr:MAG: hypothetical protein AMJ88_06110 [Anaerolineae bacterium SM23_ 63]HEY48201.1 DUF1015 domain-containing protein [Anaerolineae bacterium]